MASKLRFPFVMTVSAVSLAGAACGSEVTVLSGSTSSTGGQTSSQSSTTSTTTSGTSTTSTTSASSSSGGPDGCPADLPGLYDECTIDPDQSCIYEVACQSGTQTFSLYCDGGWIPQYQECEYPGDSCPGTEIQCDDERWVRPLGSNPPAPCPETQPTEGEACFTGGMGGVWEECGYRCNNDGWVVMTCEELTQSWSNGGCLDFDD